MKPVHKQILEEYYLNAKGAFDRIEEKNLKEAVKFISGSNKIYVIGIGHSGMFGKILSMKLNHVGLKAYTVYDEINPPFEKKDLLIAISQSGETSTIVTLARKAKNLGGKVLGITSHSQSSLGKLSDILITIDEQSEGVEFPALSVIGNLKNQNLFGTLFGFNIYVLFYTLVIMIAHERGETPESIDERHSNLQ